ncbi:UDP-N-acetylmuramate--L-alanine ligase [[Eubacterium] hominis]|uniref:UDP-N-acetylmuramate--L-alanine ligase n=1 Tax=[Eubacterium] hominis TaxID=2764325 RepID=UPI003A4E564E
MLYHFIGIKGSGMASLAEIVKDRGDEVTGSDIEKFIFTQKPLEERGIKITGFDEANVVEGTTVIIGNAFHEDNPEVKKALILKEQGSAKVYWYHEFLGELVNEYTSVSIAGTHGKTTTTGMVSHVMSLAAPTGYLIGDGTGEMPKNSKYFVLESCEYQRHFLAYEPQYAIITNVELDHVDYYKDMDDYCDAFETFANQVKKGVVIFGDDESARSLKVKTNHLYYGLHEDNDVQAIHVVQNEEGMAFDVLYKKELFGSFKFPFVGKPLLWNSLGVIALGIMEGLSAKLLQEGLASFPGVKRRFTTEEKHGNVYIDDYAHHPTAVKYMIEAARIKYPGKKVIAVFKPDRYSRIFYFMDRFAEELDQADEVYLCHFPENATKEEGIDITIQDLADKCQKAKVILEDEKAAEMLAKRGPAVYLFMSSKDIYKLKNVVKSFH